MIDELLKSGKISKPEYDVYMLFHASEMGRNWFEQGLLDTFMDQPAPDNCKGVTFAYIDGTRNTFRNIKHTLDRIFKLLGEMQHDSIEQRESE